MNGAARAIGSEFWRRHRWGWFVLGGYMLGLWAVKLLILGPSYPITLAPPNGMAGLIISPVSLTIFYFIGVFSYGLSGDLAARESIFPARMFTLPVTTAALAGWPMLYGTAATISLWLVTASLVRLAGIDVTLPLVWPALLASAYLAWIQALVWMPYGLRGVRVIVAVLWLIVVDTIVLVTLHYKAREIVMVAILAPQIPFAYLLARVAVGRARRGDVPDWRVTTWFEPFVGSGFSRTAHGFFSPARAQAWIEWRQHGRTLPAMVALVVPIELVLLFLRGNDTAPIVFLVIFAALLTPPFMAAFAAPALSTPALFTATRPLTSVGLIAAKLKMTIWSTLAAWLLVIVFIPPALALSGRMPVVVERARAGLEVAGTFRGIALALLVLTGLIASTWKHLVQSLCIGLTGHEWLIRGSVLLTLALLVAAGPLADGIITDSDVQAVVWNGLPWVLVALVGVKLCAASWVGIRLADSRLLSDRTLVAGAACWLGAVLAVYGVLEWFAASPLVPRYFLGAVAILMVPLARVSAAPLALEWSRHR